MGSFRKISDIISIDDSGSNEIICVNGQWQFTLPDGLSYGVNEEFSLIEGGIDLSGSVKPLVIKEDWSVYDQAFCASVAEHYSFTGDHITIIDCKYDNRFSENNGMNSQKVIVDEDDFYVDLTSVNTWPFGVQAEIRVRGEGITPYNISMMVKPEGDDHWQHIADYFKEIVFSICKSKKTAKTKSTSKKATQSVSDPNCIMSGTVLQRYVGNEADVVLPEGITELADNIFSGRGDLRSIVIPEGVTRIGNRAFENCFKLKNVVLPTSLSEIGDYAFVDCHELENINLDGRLESIAGSTFSECFKLQNVFIPKTVKYIDAFAFKNCRAFTKIVIPEGVTSIGFTAFAACTNLEYLYIPASVTGIYDNFMGQTPFDGCSNLTIYCPANSSAKEYAQQHNISYIIESTPPKDVAKRDTTKQKTSKPHTKRAEATPDLTSQEPAEPFQLSDDGKTLIAYTGKEKNVVVPQSVSIVSERAFYKSKATSVTLQNGVETIGKMAFASSNLKSITLPDSLKEIGAYAFSRCKKLTQINLPNSDTAVGEYAFWKCESLTSVTWPGTIKVLPRSAFDDCASLETVILEEGVTEIGHSVFFFSANLKDLYLPESLHKIDSCALPLLGKPTLHVYQDSYAEKYAKENNLPAMILLTPEQEAEKKRQEEARRIAEEKYAAELKAWEQTCGEIRAQREHRVSELLEEKRTSLQNQAQSKYNAAVTAANKRKEAAQQKKADAEMRLSNLGVFKFAEKKAAKAAIEEAVGEIQAVEAALVTAKQTLDKELAAIPATINSHRYMVSREVEQEYLLPAKPEKPL